MYAVTETANFRENLQEESARLPYLRHTIEQRLYPRLESEPRTLGWYDRHQDVWYTRFEVVGPILEIQVKYAIDDQRRLISMHGLEVVDYEPEPM